MPEGLVEVADLGELASSNCNDMVVDSRGCAYVGSFGFDIVTESFSPAEMQRW